MDYFTDLLLRPTDPALGTGHSDVSQEITRILSRGVVQGQMSEADQAYLAKVVSERAGISEADAQRRLNDISAQAKQTVHNVESKAQEAADIARKAAAAFSLWAFAALLVGAFVASLGATIGGRARDY